MEPGAPLARTVEETDDEAGDLESIHAGVDHGQEDDPTEELSRQRPRPHHPRERRRRRRVRRERGDRRGHVPNAVGLPGVPRAAGLHRLARAVRHARRLDEHAGLVRHAAGARPRVRPPARAHPRHRGAARRRVRRQVRARRAARGRRRARAEAAGPPRASRAREDFQATNPASAQVTRLKIGARADGTLTGIEARMIVDRGSNAGWGVEGITSLLVAGPYRWEAHDLRGYGVQTNRFTFGAYRAPGRADRRLRPRVAARRARGGARARPDRAAPEERGRRGRRRHQRQSVSRHRRARGARADPRAPAVGDARLAAGGRRDRHGAGHWPGGLEPAAAVCRVDADGTMTVVTSAADMSGVELGLRRHRRGRVRPLAGPGARRHGRHELGAVRRRRAAARR